MKINLHDIAWSDLEHTRGNFVIHAENGPGDSYWLKGEWITTEPVERMARFLADLADIHITKQPT